MALRDNFMRDRDLALKSLNKQKIMDYAKQYNVMLPLDQKTFWAAVHKARIAIMGGVITEEDKQVSREWLRSNGYRPEGF